MADLRFYVNNALTHENIGRLYPIEYSLGDPLTGSGEGRITVNYNSKPGQNSLVKRIGLNKTELVVCVGPMEDNKIVWAGWIDSRTPVAKVKTLTFTVNHWTAWPYHRVVPPKTFGNSNVLYDDEYQIVYDLIDWATAPSAAPAISHDATQAGNDRQLTVNDWWSVGEALDTMGKRANGYEWTIDCVWDGPTERTKLVLRIWEPGASRLSNNLVIVENTNNRTANIGDVVADGAQQATRVFATSDGDEPVYSSDSNEDLGIDGVLLLETVTTYNDNRNKALLFEYARAERIERNNPYSTVPVTITLDSPDVSKYRVGDTARLRVNDSWNTIDVSGVRIIERTIAKSPGTIASATLTLDLSSVAI